MRQRWEADELVERWTLDPEDLALAARKAGANRLGFAALLAFFAHEGRFPTAAAELPPEVAGFLARQVGLEPSALAAYDWSGRTWKAHRAEVRRRFGFREWTDADAPALRGWLAAALSAGPRRDQLVEGLRGWCRARRIEPPAAAQIERLVGSAVRRFEGWLSATIAARLAPAAAAALDALVAGEGRSMFARLRTEPGPVGLATVLEEIGP